MRSVNRILIALCSAVFLGTQPGTCQSLAIPSYLGASGASIPFAVSFESGSASIVALQFDLSFDDSALSLSPIIGSAARSSGKSLFLAPPTAGRTRVAVWEFNQTPIPDGVILNLFANVAPTAPAGTYPIHVAFVAAVDASGHSVPINTSDGALTVRSFSGTPVAAEAVLNGASLLPGPVAPGEVITIIGSAIGASTVAAITLDNITAPVVSRTPDKVTAVVPYEVADRPAVTLSITNAAGATASISMRVVSSAPAIFTASGSGAGPGAILNQDATLNSHDNPAAMGSLVTIFATGAGQTDPPGIDGLITSNVLPQPILPVSVQIGNATAQIVYAAAAPGMTSGILQVNCRVPTQIQPGDAVPVTLTIGSATSPPVSVSIH